MKVSDNISMFIYHHTIPTFIEESRMYEYKCIKSINTMCEIFFLFF